MMRGGGRGRSASTYLWSREDAQVAEGSFDLSTACPAGYVPFLSRDPPSVFSLAEGILPADRFKEGVVSAANSRYSFCCL